ncbi:hypothetical protein [Desulfosporosinus sp. BICA1-9]|uniref:hypothetical protein n=1 Tax=Desulfosporosinus sp. BICA1-9 TaxID=1531958 RepID=UPI00054C28E4|nr:hypothetical protein [Desulfosporosinus sp. BICA1-9]KJS48831.1 MAG: hypothetical protein VR66_11880 [Peptococcaceae bacterium BRH_c23]KJS87079.1 MAG: hypothetical protein JL57_15010 [Desulfosporosinus sp. BICA1-9]HBW34173.1 hypothetical protein [Desulfosporosinus sp.]
MINAQPAFIPLFFDEAETDLWLAIQQIEPEERSSFIKAILRQVLLGNCVEELLVKENQNSASNLPEDEETSKVNDQEIQADSPDDELERTETFSLEALFEVKVPDQDTEQIGEFDLESLREEKPIRPAGFEYMMKHIIGTEEDEAVLKVLQGMPSEKGQ